MKKPGFSRYIILTVMGLILAVSSGCRRVENTVWAEFCDIPSDGWDPIHIYSLQPWPVDSVVNPGDRFDIALACRFLTGNHPRHLHLAYSLSLYDSILRSDTLTLDLLPPRKRPGGYGSYGVYEVIDTVIRDIELIPGTPLDLRNLTTREQTAGILEVGARLSLSGHNDGNWWDFSKIRDLSLNKKE